MAQPRGDPGIEIAGRLERAVEHSAAAVFDRAAQPGRVEALDRVAREIGLQVEGRGHGRALQPTDDFVTHAVYVALPRQRDRCAAGEVNAPEIDLAAPGLPGPAEQGAEPHAWLRTARELPGEGGFLGHPVVREGHREQSAGAPGRLETAQ